MTPAIDLRNITYRAQANFWQRPKDRIEGLSLSVAQGEICAFLGANGAGKTTTIHLALGLLRPTSGVALLFGCPSHEPRSRLGVGYLPERAVSPLPLTAASCVRAHAIMAGLTAAEARRRSGEVLGQVGLAGREGQLLRHFSKGMLQRVGLAQALVGRPRLLILDEPLSGLDPQGRHLVRRIISEVGAAGCAVLFSTHVLADVEHLCDRAAIMHKGQLRHVGSPKELLSHLGAHSDAVEVVVDTLTPAAQAAAGKIGASAQNVRGGGYRFVAHDLTLANALVACLQSHGSQIRLMAPQPQGGLEALFAAEAIHD